MYELNAFVTCFIPNIIGVAFDLKTDACVSESCVEGVSLFIL